MASQLHHLGLEGAALRSLKLLSAQAHVQLVRDLSQRFRKSIPLL